MNSERIWELLAKKKTDELNADELAELEELVRDTPGTVTNEIMDKVWETPLRSLPEMNPGSDTWNRIQNRINRPSRVLAMKPWMAAAAITAIVATTVLFYFNRTIPSGDVAANIQNRITTEPLSKTKIELPDGTQVWLNGSSQLTYNSDDFGKKNREVQLSGEAFFDVVRNTERPFIIHTGPINITVKGTAFNVKAYPGQKNIETALIRGLIEITTDQDPERKILVRPNEKIIFPITPPAYTEIPENKEDNSLYTITRLHKDVHEVLPETVWMKKKLQFNNETFEELAPKLESWYAVTIHFRDSAITSKRFSGVIEKETLEQTLQAMKIASAFNYAIKNDEVLISK